MSKIDTGRRVRTVPKKGSPIIIPNAEFLTPEELKRAKHNERVKRYLARRRGAVEMNPDTKIGLRKLKNEELIDASKSTRDIAIQALNKKLIEIYDNPEELRKVNLVQLATTFAILFDKSQLIQGLATENLAIRARIDINMNSSQALEQLNKIREGYSKVNDDE